MHFGPAHAGGAAGRAANLPIALPSAAVNSRAKPPGDALPHPAGFSSDGATRAFPAWAWRHVADFTYICNKIL